MDVRDEELWNQAWDTVLRVRGSCDVPAFEYCVECEYQILLEKKNEDGSKKTSQSI